MHRGIKQFHRDAQVPGEKAGEVEGAQFRVTHGTGSNRRNPCECDMCSSIATAEIITRSGVMLACPDCARTELGNIRIQIIVQGERHERQSA